MVSSSGAFTEKTVRIIRTECIHAGSFDRRSNRDFPERRLVHLWPDGLIVLTRTLSTKHGRSLYQGNDCGLGDGRMAHIQCVGAWTSQGHHRVEAREPPITGVERKLRARKNTGA
jgi:hypothetical protein